MIYPASALTPENWIRNVFDCKVVNQGQVIRRKLRDLNHLQLIQAALIFSLFLRGLWT